MFRYRLTKTHLLFSIFHLLFFISKAQTTLLVTNTADSGPGSLRAVVASAVNGDTIRFDPASFTGGKVQTIILTSNLIVFSQDNLVFKGFYNSAGDTVKVSGNNAGGILDCTASNSLVVDSMILINARGGNGGGINTSTQMLTVNNSILSNNTCNYYGGAINASDVVVNNSILNNNSAPAGGGGAINAIQSTIINNSIFSNNSASDYAGAIVCDSVTISNSTFTNNSSGDGGGIFAPNSVIVSNSIFSGNYSGSDGGGISCVGNVTVTNSTFSGDTAANRGAGVFDFNGCDNCGNITISNSTLNGNIAYTGAGLYACKNVTATNCTLNGNVAAIGGGICAALTNAINSTITGNTATFSSSYGPGGGGIEGVSIEATSSIIALNFGGDIIDVAATSTLIATGGYNIFTDKPNGATSTDQIGIDSIQLNLGILKSNGGTTFTMLPGAGSIAIGKGNPNDGTNDQRGFPIPSGTVRDVGAVSVSAIDACTWTGSISTAWENSTNWDCGHIPVASTVVSINPTARYPVINSPAICKSLKLTPGTSCIVNKGGINIISK